MTKEVLATGKPKRDEGAMRYFPELPPEYAGGLEKEGAAALKDFVEKGGTLVALSSSTEYVIDELALPVRNGAARARRFAIAGSILRAEVASGHPVTYGLPREVAVFQDEALAFDTVLPGPEMDRRVLASYPAAPVDVLLSGWMRGPEAITRKAAAVALTYGKGKVVLLGFRAQHRAQTPGRSRSSSTPSTGRRRSSRGREGDFPDRLPLVSSRESPGATKSMPSANRPLIIDVEASGFGGASYPIEIGLALDDGHKYCTLILPEPDWTHWDAEAEKVHRIARDLLETYGRPGHAVAETLNELLASRTVYTDGWVVDKPWLTTLFHAARTPMLFQVSSLEMILSESQMADWHREKEAVLAGMDLSRHRASHDAWVIQETYRRTRQAAEAA